MSCLEIRNVTLDVRFGQTQVQVLNRSSLVFPERRICLAAESRVGTVSVLDLLCRRLIPQSGSVHFAGRVSWPIGHPGPLSVAVTGFQALSHLSTLYGFDRGLAISFIKAEFEDPSLLRTPILAWPRRFQSQFMLLMSLVPNFDVYLVDGNLVQPEDVAFSQRFLELFTARTKHKTMIMTARQAPLVRALCDCAVLVRGQDLVLTDDVALALSIGARLPTLSAPEVVEEDASMDEFF